MNNQKILDEARTYIDGLLLSDGSVQSSSCSGIYRQNCKYMVWLEKIKEDFSRWGIKSEVDGGKFIFTNFSQNRGSLTYRLWTHSYEEFKLVRERWYISWCFDSNTEEYKNIKIVPKDIILSSDCCGNWYLGDGSRRRSHNEINFATNGFKKDDVVFLSDLLSDTLDIKCSISKRNTIGIFNKRGVDMFLNYINNYIVSCYNYKFITT